MIYDKYSNNSHHEIYRGPNKIQRIKDAFSKIQPCTVKELLAFAQVDDNSWRVASILQGECHAKSKGTKDHQTIWGL
jgi:hypothetical protein